VASATADKLRANVELSDLTLALGVQPGARFNIDDLRYERVVIMTDADVDGAHIAALLITYFHRVMPDVIRQGRLFMALPPLYRIQAGALSEYARDDAHRDELLATTFKGKKVEIGRFKGLGEMMASQLKDTTMNPRTRTLARVTVPDDVTDLADVEDLVERLMGKKADARFRFIQDNARFVKEELDV
jgi:topoisomerase IV subunit B